MKAPQHLLKAWPALRKQLAGKRRVLLTDFDGTLSPIAQHPSTPRLSPRLDAMLRRIAKRDVVGIVTGRVLRDIRCRVGIRGIWYAGSHGYEICAPNGKKRLQLSGPERKLVGGVTRAVKRKLAGLPGLIIEAKPAMVAIHYRRARRAVQERARLVVDQIADRCPGVQLMSGKKVWDLAPRRPEQEGGKWAAVQFILRAVGKRAKRAATVAYIGDDTTDEQVFRHLQGITVVVGKRSKTAAGYFLRSPAEVVQFLQRWEEES